MSLTGRALAGDRPEGRPENDFYPTPSYATEALIKSEMIAHCRVWEPACGDGAISKVLEGHGCNVFSTDIEPRGFGEQRDFLSGVSPRRIENDWIITNPPFKYAKQFIERAKYHNPQKIAMFLKIQFLEGAGRQSFLMDRDFPLSKVLVFSKRVTLAREGQKLKNSGTICFAWYIWSRNHIGQARIGWL